MKSIRVMVFGIGLLLLGIFCKLVTVNRILGEFWGQYFPIGVVIVGILCLCMGLVGFLDKE